MHPPTHTRLSFSQPTIGVNNGQKYTKEKEGTIAANTTNQTEPNRTPQTDNEPSKKAHMIKSKKKESKSHTVLSGCNDQALTPATQLFKQTTTKAAHYATTRIEYQWAEEDIGERSNRKGRAKRNSETKGEEGERDCGTIC